VIIETIDKPAERGRNPMTFSEFWNIAGRADRAMCDRVGLVTFPVTTRQQEGPLPRVEASRALPASISDLVKLNELTMRHDSPVLLWPCKHSAAIAGVNQNEVELCVLSHKLSMSNPLSSTLRF
jgi:hypothetical protein